MLQIWQADFRLGTLSLHGLYRLFAAENQTTPGERLARYTERWDGHVSNQRIGALAARLAVFDTNTGKLIERLPVIGDSDGVFYDRARKRVYATGGERGISVYQQDQGSEPAAIRVNSAQ